MAKLRPRKETRKYLGPGARNVTVHVNVSRGDEYFGGRIKACASVKGLTKGRSGPINRKRVVCERGDNPREAAGRALESLGAQLRGRKGAFAGLSRRKR